MKITKELLDRASAILIPNVEHNLVPDMVMDKELSQMVAIFKDDLMERLTQANHRIEFYQELMNDRFPPIGDLVLSYTSSPTVPTPSVILKRGENLNTRLKGAISKLLSDQSEFFTGLVSTNKIDNSVEHCIIMAEYRLAYEDNPCIATFTIKEASIF